MKRCQVKNCRRKFYAHGLCTKHYQAWRLTGKHAAIYDKSNRPCSVEGCKQKQRSKGMCIAHYKRVWRRGTTELFDRTPKPRIRPNGYVYRSIGDKQCLEHRLVMESLIGRTLLPGETVHHRNGVRSDNRPENLQLMASCHPRGQSIEDLVDFAKQILDKYEHFIGKQLIQRLTTGGHE